ncbi:MAG: hypothetical protein ABEH56_00860 [Salinirussus sp.]
MFDAPIDALYTWFGVGLVSIAMLGVVAGLPAAPPPDPAPVVTTVDAVAASPHLPVERIAVPAREVRLGSDGISLRGPGGAAHGTFAFGPVTPVADGPLAPVLAGASPRSRFASRDAFLAALRTARDADRRWRGAPDRLTVRRVEWGETSATLVG